MEVYRDPLLGVAFSMHVARSIKIVSFFSPRSKEEKEEEEEEEEEEEI